MSKNMSNTIHPLFDDRSRYRLGCNDSTWSDGGKESIRNLFRGLHQVELDSSELAEEGITDQVQDWGFDEQTNKEIQEYRKQIRQSSTLEEERVYERVTNEAEERHSGAVRSLSRQLFPKVIEGFFVMDLIQNPGKLGLDLKEHPRWAISGMDESTRNEKINTFKVKIPELPDGRRGMLLLFSPSILEQLAGLLKAHLPESQDELFQIPRSSVKGTTRIREALLKVLSAETLEPSVSASVADHWRAEKLSMVLSAVPGLEGITSNGTLKMEVDLQQEYAHLPTDMVPLVCLGPLEDSE